MKRRNALESTSYRPPCRQRGSSSRFYVLAACFVVWCGHCGFCPTSVHGDVSVEARDRAPKLAVGVMWGNKGGPGAASDGPREIVGPRTSPPLYDVPPYRGQEIT